MRNPSNNIDRFSNTPAVLTRIGIWHILEAATAIHLSSTHFMVPERQPQGTELENEPLVSHPSMVHETEIENEVKQSTMVMRGESEQSVRWIGSGI